LSDYLGLVQYFFIELLLFGLLFTYIETLNIVEKIGLFRREIFSDILYGIINTLIMVPVVIVFYEELLQLINYPTDILKDHVSNIGLGLQVFIALIVIDFSVYVRHRFTHKYMWKFHSIHHGIKSISWSSGLRLHPIEVALATLVDVLLLKLIGFSDEAVFFSVLTLKAYNFYTHANINIKYPKPLCFVLASPHYHRWHHSNESSAIDKNFCVVFSLLDVVFGTYHHPSHLTVEYGLKAGEMRNYPKELYKQLTYPFKG
jgi:sterol desaturase/sphingolipid hydroxylase (fatty acid hydroxylase superfamily)